MYFDSTFIILIPALILSLYAQYKVQSTFNRYSEVFVKNGLTGADVARKLLAKEGITDVIVEPIGGNLTDHYDPRSKRLRLSSSVFGSNSIAAIGVAAHETGHAIQHASNYVPLSIRNSIVPLASIGSNMATPFIFLGFLFASFGTGAIGMLMVNIGIILFTFAVLFQVITLPVEFNASNTAISILDENRILTEDELGNARKVLNAAALTYVAAAAVAVLNLVRLLALANRRRD